MKLTHLSNDTEPRRALRTHRPGAVLTATDGGEHVSFSIPAGLSVWRVFVASYPWPAALYQGPCPPAVGTALLVIPPVLRPCQRGARKGWTGQSGTPAPLSPISFIPHQLKEREQCPEKRRTCRGHGHRGGR